jgi:hypothetical protein
MKRCRRKLAPKCDDKSKRPGWSHSTIRRKERTDARFPAVGAPCGARLAGRLAIKVQRTGLVIAGAAALLVAGGLAFVGGEAVLGSADSNDATGSALARSNSQKLASLAIAPAPPQSLLVRKDVEGLDVERAPAPPAAEIEATPSPTATALPAAPLLSMPLRRQRLYLQRLRRPCGPPPPAIRHSPRPRVQCRHRPRRPSASRA